MSLSRLHAQVRYFALEPSARSMDDALTRALRTESEPGTETVVAYGRALDSVCVTPADDRPLGPARVELRGTTAWVVPGTGAVTLPAGAEAVVLDLSDLPDAPGLEDALARAVSAVTATALPQRVKKVIRRTGLTDEAVFAQSLYVMALGEVLRPVVLPENTTLSLAVLSGKRMAPVAAEFAFALRLSGQAHLFGEELLAEVAEAQRSASFAGVSVAVRDGDLIDDFGRIPDVLPADVSSVPESFASLAPPSLVVERSRLRSKPSLRNDFGDTRAKGLDEATLRAALLAAHGAARLFFPYFELLDADFDARLRETWALTAEAATSRSSARDLLRRLGNALQDGHGWVLDSQQGFAGVLPLAFEEVEASPVVSRSLTPLLARGDVLTHIGEIEARAWVAEQKLLSYGATDGHRFFTAMSELQYPPAPVTFRVRTPSGEEKTVTPPLLNGPAANAELYSGSTRAHGSLADRGYPDLYYLNLDGTYAGSDAELMAHLTDAEGARGLILDLRGHPANGGAAWDPYAFLQRIIPHTFSSPRYRVPVYTGSQQLSEFHPYEGSYGPLSAPQFTGNLVLILDGRAVSFAEDFAMMLVGAGRATVVGRPSSGTTGSVTGMLLPGGFSFHLTGMDARWPDGSRLFGIGVTPDVAVNPTLAEYAADPDPFLTAAIQALAE